MFCLGWRQETLYYMLVAVLPWRGGRGFSAVSGCCFFTYRLYILPLCSNQWAGILQQFTNVIGTPVVCTANFWQRKQPNHCAVLSLVTIHCSKQHIECRPQCTCQANIYVLPLCTRCSSGTMDTCFLLFLSAVQMFHGSVFLLHHCCSYDRKRCILPVNSFAAVCEHVWPIWPLWYSVTSIYCRFLLHNIMG